MRNADARAFDPRLTQYDMWRDKSRTIGVIVLPGGVHADNRSVTALSTGVGVILSELRYQYEYCTVDRISQYQVALLPLLSVSDVVSAVEHITPEVKGACTIIAGGFGCVNVRSLLGIVDVAVFGRAEGQINDILDGATPANVWRASIDPEHRGVYEIRQAQRILTEHGEDAVGCRRQCAFCQYTWTRRLLGDDYSHTRYLTTAEMAWERVTPKPGQTTTAWDGWSEATRRKVGKPISDAEIINTVQHIIGTKYRGTMQSKIFNIVWYPWETVDTMRADVEHVKTMLAEADVGGVSHLAMTWLLTPFSPEPLTPMAHMPAAVDIDSRSVFADIGRAIRNSDHINAFILPQINSGYTLAKRVAVNRGVPRETLRAALHVSRRGSARERQRVFCDTVGRAVFDWHDDPTPNLRTWRDVPRLEVTP